MTSSHDCHYVAVRGDNGYGVLPVVNLFGKGSRVQFREDKKGVIEFGFNSDLLLFIGDRIEEHLSSGET
jgi:hypothetical protein